MNEKKSRGGLGIGPSGDNTTGLVSLSEITAINPSFMNLIGVQQPSAPPPSEEGMSSAKRNFDEITKQLQISQKRRPLLSSQETIEFYKNENLKLKVQLHKYKQALGEKSGNFQIADIEKDLDQMNQINELRKQLEERDRREMKSEMKIKDATCQTNLDGINIEELIKASITLKRQKEQMLLQKEQTPYEYPQVQQSQAPQQSRSDKHQVMSQLHYPNISTLSKQIVTKKQLAPDEKELLELAYRVDGSMTTALDKLKAVSDIS